MSSLPVAGDPFLALGLDRQAELTDDDVRSAWRRVAAATHPDRADGGDSAAFAAAAAAYTLLRTRTGRSEAHADLLAAGSYRPQVAACRHRARSWPAVRLALRFRRGRPIVLALRLATAFAAGALTVAAAGWQPASLAIIAGLLTWLVLTGRRDLAAPRR